VHSNYQNETTDSASESDTAKASLAVPRDGMQFAVAAASAVFPSQKVFYLAVSDGTLPSFRLAN